jgi:3-deoxy-7-phosphoheptulonate synthase
MKTNLACEPVNSEMAGPGKATGKHSPGLKSLSVGGVVIGDNEVVIIAGPCAVESKEQLSETARAVKSSGARILRGGAFKPRSSPYNFQGLGEDGLKLLREVSRETGLPIVTEVMDTRHVEMVSKYAEMLQIGSRNMQNYPLLKEVGLSGKPVLLKRGMMATTEEFLMAAEYIFSQGNNQLVLCERGIRTFETSTRNTLDLSAVPVLKKRSSLPVIIDPSHGTGHRWLVPSLAKAAVAVGADGLIIEVHNKPDEALCDGYQSLSTMEFNKLMSEMKRVALAVDRDIRLS